MTRTAAFASLFAPALAAGAAQANQLDGNVVGGRDGANVVHVRPR